MSSTVIPDNVNVGAGGSNQVLQDVEHEEEETGNDSNPATNDVNEEGEINAPHSASSPHPIHSTHSDLSLHFEDQHNVRFGYYNLHRSGNDHTQHAATGSTDASDGSFSSGGSGGSFLGHTSPPVPFVLAWNLTKGSNLNDAESCHDMMINLATHARSLLPLKERKISSSIRTKPGEKIKQLEEALVSKDLSLSEEKMTVDNLKGNLECLTAYLAQTEIVKNNYVSHLLPTVVQRLLSSDEYKKGFSDV
ncbi:hypothetical protein Tco_0227643, partial [Tanacetum coccineum]